MENKYIKIVFFIGLIVDFTFFIISFFVDGDSNFGDSATWFGSFITVGALGIAYWQFLISKKDIEPNIIVVEETKNLCIDFNSQNLPKDNNLFFQLINLGNGPAVNVKIDMDEQVKFQEKIKSLKCDYSFFDDMLIIGLSDTDKHINTLELNYKILPIKNYLISNESVTISISNFYTCLLKNYVYDSYLKIIDKEENYNETLRSRALQEEIKKFPQLKYKIIYRNIDNTQKIKSFLIKPSATVFENKDDSNRRQIYLGFTITNC